MESVATGFTGSSHHLSETVGSDVRLSTLRTGLYYEALVNTYSWLPVILHWTQQELVEGNMVIGDNYWSTFPYNQFFPLR